jgi:serine/threonine protein kinase
MYSSSTMNTSSHQTTAYTQEYTSPERLATFRRSKQDDVYAFGILLYFLATSRSPFTDISKHDLNRAVAAGTRPDLDKWTDSQWRGARVEQEVVVAYCELARQCWHQQPYQRPDFDAIFTSLTTLVRT